MLVLRISRREMDIFVSQLKYYYCHKYQHTLVEQDIGRFYKGDSL